MTAREREESRARAGAIRSHYTAAGCTYWLFEESVMAGAYVEFFEAPDKETLTRAHRSLAEPLIERSRLYVQVELS